MSIKFENTEVIGWEAAIRGMRNPKNSWARSDSFGNYTGEVNLGSNDYKLMTTLRNAGTDHRKFMRMIVVYVDITAPLYWWKEFDTYKVGTVANSCSTMHKIADKEFTLEDFSCEHLIDDDTPIRKGKNGLVCYPWWMTSLLSVIDGLNYARELYLETKDKKYWWQMIQLLPSSYNQKRTVMLSYEVLANMYGGRHNHKLDEWKEHDMEVVIKDGLNGYFGLCDWIHTLPYSELITGLAEEKEDL